MHYFTVEITLFHMYFIDDFGILSTERSPISNPQHITPKLLLLYYGSIDPTYYLATLVEQNYRISLRNPCKGGLLITRLLFINPMLKTNRVIPGMRIKNGAMEGIKGVSKTNIASSWVLRIDSKTPIPLPSRPKYKYSKAVIFSI